MKALPIWIDIFILSGLRRRLRLYSGKTRVFSEYRSDTGVTKLLQHEDAVHI
jgi:hypothetical protein